MHLGMKKVKFIQDFPRDCHARNVKRTFWKDQEDAKRDISCGSFDQTVQDETSEK